MDLFLALAGFALIVLAWAFLYHGGITITIKKTFKK